MSYKVVVTNDIDGNVEEIKISVCYGEGFPTLNEAIDDFAEKWTRRKRKTVAKKPRQYLFPPEWDGINFPLFMKELSDWLEKTGEKNGFGKAFYKVTRAAEELFKKRLKEYEEEENA
ncbi:hypothetical protein J6U78_03725 [bacterium]|nr:hypothetical protein [bacterium]